MCGFVGYTHVENNDDGQIIRKMTDAIKHRGPDSDGIYSDDKIALGFRRLSIIDLSEVAKQPMFNENEDIVLVFNGEIYNYQSLREDLLAKGHQFHSHTDSEVIIHGYEEYGVEILSKLRGMFAFSIWDTKRQRLFIARDYFGIKPLYYTQNTKDGSLLFGSEIKSFLQNPNFNKELNKDALRPYLTFQYSSMEETFFKGVYKLKPAHYLMFENDTLKTVPYWHTEFKVEKNDLKTNVEQIKKILKESVEYHKISDVKVGSFLSGGVDSSYITALLKPNKTFSVGFQEYEAMFNETHLAEELSQLLGIENHKKIITADECFDALPIIQYHMDEPQSNPSSVPLYFLAELAREHVTVVLSGEGADEIFGGYPWYQNSPAIDAYEKIPFGIRHALSSAAKGLPKNKVTNFIVRGGVPVEEKFIGEAKVFDEADALAVLKPAYQNGPSVRSITKAVYDKVKNEDDLTKMQYLDLNLWLPGDILLKADKMSMAHSLELRVPFLDKEVMKLAATLPSKQRVNKENTKYALRVAAHEMLPEAWAKRPKLGFPVPIKYWMKEEKYYNLIRKEFENPKTGEFFDQKLLLHYLESHYKGIKNYARYIWTVYVFLVWHNQFFGESK
jgi:asparagine synthase (glutamine-hydrolysing)